MKEILFTKMVGAGNDFIVVDNRLNFIKKDAAKLAIKLSDRKFSIGADGLILLEKAGKSDVRMRILNPDGSEAEMCGNGVRCLAKFVADHRITGSKLSIETLAGTVYAEVKGNTVKAKMVDPKDIKLNFEIQVNGHKESLSFINTGVPHAIKIVSSVSDCDVEKLGERIRRHEYFAPRGTNVDFVSVKKNNGIEVRTYERGVEAETLACGTGSTAAALVTAAVKNLKSPVMVHTKGGEVLKIYFSKTGRVFRDVYLEGRILKSFEGKVVL